MKLDKEKFLKTELGEALENRIRCWDAALAIEDYNSAKFCQAQWAVYQLAIKQFYGIEYHFTRNDDYFGLVTEDYKDWLFKIERGV